MKIDLDFLGGLKKSKAFSVVDQIPSFNNVYEYAIEVYEEGHVTGTMYLENEIIDQFDVLIGHFGVNFEHKVLAYNLKKDKKNDNVKELGKSVKQSN